MVKGGREGTTSEGMGKKKQVRIRKD